MKKRRLTVWIHKKNIAAAAGMMVSVILISQILRDSGMREVGELSRPALSQGQETESMIVVRENGEKLWLDVSVSSRQLSEEEAKELFEKAMVDLPDTVKGDNHSLEQIMTDLYFPTVLEQWGMRLRWKSSDPALIDHVGRVNRERTLNQPQRVIIEVEMSLQKYVFSEEITVIVWPVEAPSWEARLSGQLERAEEASCEKEIVQLPSQFEGENIYFAVPDDQSKEIAMALLPAVAGLLILNGGGKREDKRRQKRREEITADYPELIIKMTVLYQAGLSMRGVWERIAADAVRKGGKLSPIYEEVCYACNCMAEGIPEPEVYRQFGHRCSTGSCLKLGNLLAGNVRRGTRQLSVLMAQESERAWELRKHRARRNGEKAGTKMLLPMFMMFAVVLAMVVIPAFYSFMI